MRVDRRSIADALLDYQYWAPNDPQTRPYDDTGWTFPEGFGVEAVRVVDHKVLRLHRESMGPLLLDAHLAPGQYRALSPEEVGLI